MLMSIAEAVSLSLASVFAGVIFYHVLFELLTVLLWESAATLVDFSVK